MLAHSLTTPGITDSFSAGSRSVGDSSVVADLGGDATFEIYSDDLEVVDFRQVR